MQRLVAVGSGWFSGVAAILCLCWITSRRSLISDKEKGLFAFFRPRESGAVSAHNGEKD